MSSFTLRRSKRSTPNDVKPTSFPNAGRMIDNLGDLDGLLSNLSEAGIAGIDTEMVWERTFYPKLGIIQVASPPDDCFLIDVPAVAGGSRV